MEGEDGGMGSPEKEDYESSSHSTPQEHRSFAEFAKDKLDSGAYYVLLPCHINNMLQKYYFCVCYIILLCYISI